jgi:hypothetical protein
VSDLTRWQREQLGAIADVRAMLQTWPPLLSRHLLLELDRLAVSVRHDLHRSVKRYISRRIRELFGDVRRMLVLTPADRVPGHLLAYSGESLPQRGELHPLMRDIVCRAIQHEIAALSQVYGDDMPPFLRGLQPDADSVERTMLRQAQLLLSPRSDDAQVLQDVIAHDVAVGVPAPVTTPDRPA